MNEILILADIHFGHKSFNKKVFEDDLSYYEVVVFPVILKNKITDVILCGDLIHNRNLSDNYIVHELKQRFFGWFEKNSVNFHILIGNHCTYYKNRIDYNWPRTNLTEFEYCHVYDIPKIVHINGYRFGFQPWIPPETVVKLHSESNIDILIGHFDINNALMQGDTKSIKGRNINEFSKYRQVISGHYHTMSNYNNVKYVGAPYQMSYRDFGNKNGYWLLGDDYKFVHVENMYSPKYLKIYYTEIDGDIGFLASGVLDEKIVVSVAEAQELIAKNYCKFIVKKYKSQSLLSEVFNKLTNNAFDRVDVINESSSVEEFDIEAFEKELDGELELIDIMRGYVDNATFSDHISKKKINKLLKEYYISTREGELHDA